MDDNKEKANDKPAARGILPIIEIALCPECSAPLHRTDIGFAHPPYSSTLFGATNPNCQYVGVAFRQVIPLTLSTLDTEVE